MANSIPLRGMTGQHLIPVETRLQIIQDYWSCPITLSEFQKDPSRSDSYFKYFEEQRRLAQLNDRLRTLFRTHRNIVTEIISELKKDKSREKIKEYILSKTADPVSNVANNDEMLRDVIDLAVRLWLMIHVAAPTPGVLTHQTAIEWSGGSIKEVVRQHFQHQLVLTNPVKFERRFNAMSLERIAGVKIQWSANFVDHLLMKEDGANATVTIFHHASFLDYHRHCDIFPKELIRETENTLALLLPEYDQETASWFKKKQEELGLDEQAARCGQLKLQDRQIDHFKFWHDRLIVIKQFFDDSEPRTITQWWFDDRKRKQWFWVAIVVVVTTILFGIIQCFEGGWQIYKAYYPSS